MKEYQYISILKVFIIYIIALIPVFISLFDKTIYLNQKNFIKKNCLLIVIEIAVFSIIYLFSNSIVTLFSTKTNIQNYMIYSLKILFIASSTTVLHYTIPLYMFLKHKKTGIFLWILKLSYIPVILISYSIFNIKGAFFAIPFCDILYNIILIVFCQNV